MGLFKLFLKFLVFMFFVAVSFALSLISVWIPIVLWAPFVGKWMFGKLDRHIDEKTYPFLEGTEIDIDTTKPGWLLASLKWGWDAVKWAMVRFAIGIGLYSCLIWSIRSAVLDGGEG